MAKIEQNLGLSFGWIKGEDNWNTGMDTNLRKIGATGQISVASLSVNTPPGVLVEGYRCVVGNSPTGAFSGQAGKLAVAVDGGYEFHTIETGWLLFNETDNTVYVWDGAAFTGVGGGASTFTNLTDVPASYTGHANKTVKVKADETGLEFVNVTTPSTTQCIAIACSDETTALTTGTAKSTFRMPYAFTLTEVRASLTTAQGSGTIFTVDINEGGVSILSTKLTIDNTEKTSTTATTPAVISDTSLADDAEITIDIDQIGNGTAAGLKIYLIGVKT